MGLNLQKCDKWVPGAKDRRMIMQLANRLFFGAVLAGLFGIAGPVRAGSVSDLPKLHGTEKTMSASAPNITWNGVTSSNGKEAVGTITISFASGALGKLTDGTLFGTTLFGGSNSGWVTFDDFTITVPVDISFSGTVYSGRLADAGSKLINPSLSLTESIRIDGTLTPKGGSPQPYSFVNSSNLLDFEMDFGANNQLSFLGVLFTRGVPAAAKYTPYYTKPDEVFVVAELKEIGTNYGNIAGSQFFGTPLGTTSFNLTSDNKYKVDVWAVPAPATLYASAAGMLGLCVLSAFRKLA
jgi:hypothetical protein